MRAIQQDFDDSQAFSYPSRCVPSFLIIKETRQAQITFCSSSWARENAMPGISARRCSRGGLVMIALLLSRRSPPGFALKAKAPSATASSCLGRGEVYEAFTNAVNENQKSEAYELYLKALEVDPSFSKPGITEETLWSAVSSMELASQNLSEKERNEEIFRRLLMVPESDWGSLLEHWHKVRAIDWFFEKRE